MPKQYERMKDKFVEQGLPEKDAKTKAARIFNARRKPGQAPVTGPHNQPKGVRSIRPY